MRAYKNGMKATEFTRKQIGVIYRNAKLGNLKVENWIISEFYNLADYYGHDDNRNVENDEKAIKSILDSVFADDLAKAQELIDKYTEKSFNLLGLKMQNSINREFVA